MESSLQFLCLCHAFANRRAALFSHPVFNDLTKLKILPGLVLLLGLRSSDPNVAAYLATLFKVSQRDSVSVQTMTNYDA